MKANKTRRGYVLWPVLIMSAVSIAGACSGSSGSGTNGGDGGTATGGSGEPVDSGGSGAVNTGASSSMGGDEATGAVAGMSSGGVEAGGAGGVGVGGAGVDLCVDLDLNCPDDDNPCTEDECNPATGECGIPRSETACDDGLYCNGEDECVEGECIAGEADPCDGRACNEAMNSCECVTDAHCPVDMPGEWSVCEYATECIETGERTRPVTTFTCTDGMCAQGATVEDEACTRETDTNTCASDNLRCNGVEACKNGACTPAGTNQCPNQPATPNCAESGTLCNECTTGAHCAGGEKCCNRECIPTGNTCFIIIPALSITPATISPSASISPAG